MEDLGWTCPLSAFEHDVDLLELHQQLETTENEDGVVQIVGPMLAEVGSLRYYQGQKHPELLR